MLEGTYTFTPANLLVGQAGYPAIVEQDNGDGTFQVHFDLGNMRPSQKLAALLDVKSGAAKKILGL